MCSEVVREDITYKLQVKLQIFGKISRKISKSSFIYGENNGNYIRIFPKNNKITSTLRDLIHIQISVL